MLPVLYINLDRDLERRAHIERLLTQDDVGSLRIRALEVPFVLRGTVFDGSSSAAETACYASHIKAWDTLLASRNPYAMVIEDDAVLPPRLARLIKCIVAALPEHWDLVHLYGDEGRATRPLRAIDAERELVRYSRAPAGAVGYLISRSGAAKLRQREVRSWPIDTDLRRPWHFGLDSYGVSPPVVGHSGLFASTLGGKRARGRRGLALSNPLHSFQGALWNMRKLGLLWWLRCLALNGRRRIVGTAAKAGHLRPRNDPVLNNKQSALHP
jgi:glycosyl transferase family 25